MERFKLKSCKRNSLIRLFPTLFLIFIAFLVNFSSAISQSRWEYNKDAERRFSAALKKYTHGEFSDAAAEFEYLLKLPPHQRTTAAHIMLGKAYLQAKQLRESVKVLKQFIDSYPESFYIDDAYYTLGLNYEMQHRLDDALVQFLEALEVTDDPKLHARALSLCERLADEKLTLPMLEDVLRDVHNPDSRDFLSIKIAEKYLATANVIMGEKILEPVVKGTPPSPYSSRAQALLEKIRLGVNVKIGVLLPLMNRATQKQLKAYGEEFLLGMQFALEEQRTLRNSLVDISLEVRDTERDLAIAAKQTQEIANDKSVVAILGPIFNAEAVSCAGIANAKEIPLITPAANADGIAAVGPYVFQANPDISTQGIAAAQYVTSVLGMRALAVLAPNDGNGKTMAAAFAHEALSRGAKILAIEWYPPGTTDLREQLMRIRRVSLTEAEPLLSFAEQFSQSDIMHMVEAGVKPRTIDSLMDRSATVSVDKLFGPNGKHIADSLHLHTFVPEMNVENLELPAAGVQAIYMPINSPEEIGILTSQIIYYNIKCQLLGSGQWYDRVELDTHKRYADGVIFFSDFFLDTGDSLYTHFAKRWYEKTKKKVSTNVVLGYDVLHLVSNAIFEGATTRDRLTQMLSTYQHVPGLHGKVTLKRNRVNSELHVLQFKDEDIKKIAEVSIQ